MEIKLDESDLLTGMEASIILEALTRLNLAHKEAVEEAEKNEQIPFCGMYFIETMVNHGLLWKLQKFTNKAGIDCNPQLKAGKL
jgi:hypothetical protein